MPERLVLANAQIIDGSGKAPFMGSVTIEHGRVVAVGPDAPEEDAERIDVAGWAVAPGFIDMHTHSDVSALSDPDCVSAVWQGVTSQIVGHCGFSAAPTDAASRRTLRREEPVFGFPGGDGQYHDWGWGSVEEYLQAVEAARPRTNLGTLVGHNSLRRLVVGSADRAPTPEELTRMESLVEAALDEGALGLSSGLSYPPGMYAESAEISALARLAARAGKRYHTHMRYGGVPIRECLGEAIQVGRDAECPVNVSHLYPAIEDDHLEAGRLLEMIAAENRAGGDVTFDLTLFRRGGGAFSQSLPSWAAHGGLAALVDRIQDPEQRMRLVADIARLHGKRDWNDDLIVKVSGHKSSSLVGRTIGDVAAELGAPPAETVVGLLEADPQFWVAPNIKRQSDLDTLLGDERCVPVTDGMAAHPDKHAHLGLMPKTFGTFPLLLGDYVRSRRVLTIGEAVARATSVPAERLGLSDRGRLQPGYRADLVVFDPATIANTASDDDPGQPPVGVRDVMVNGSWALLSGRLTAERNGEVLR